MTKKLLLADDSITIQKVIGIIFETEDYQLLMTDNGDEAFTQALEELPDLVIADISMPGKDGFELCQAIKSDPQLSNTSVMLLPGTFDHFDEERAQAVGADGWLTKPFESQALLDKVVQLLEADPVRLVGAAAEEPVADFVPPVVEAVAVSTVDEVVLGLDEIEGSVVAEETIEESPDDIWDAVSFEEDDLQEQAELAVEETPDSADFSFADSAEEEEAVTAAEPAVENPLDLMDERDTEDPVVEAAAFAAAEETAELVLEDQEPVIGIETVLSEKDDGEPIELEDELLETSSSEVAADADIEEFEPLDLTEESVVVEEPAVTELLSPVAAREEFVVEGPAAVEEELPLVEPLPEESLDEDEEILDLGAEDILDEEPLLDATVTELAEPIELEDEVIEEESFGKEEVPLAEEISAPLAGSAEPIELEEEVAEEESFFIEDTVLLADETAEPIDASEEALTSPAVEEDDGFYFDSSEAGEAEVEESVAAATVASVKSEGDIEQVEQQLRQLSEDDLKEVVSKVAGPIIERLAGELLEQIAWEVVPDLAESMIREEIRKIKQAEE